MDCLSSFLQAVSGYLVNLDACNSFVIPLLFFFYCTGNFEGIERKKPFPRNVSASWWEKKKKCNSIHRIPSRIWVSRTKRDRPTEGNVKEEKKKKSREKRNVTPNIATDAKSLICPVAFFFLQVVEHPFRTCRYALHPLCSRSPPMEGEKNRYQYLSLPLLCRFFLFFFFHPVPTHFNPPLHHRKKNTPHCHIGD